jgi:hypothetical protein
MKMKKGRPGVIPSEIVARADNYRQIFWKTRLDPKKKEWVRDRPEEWAEQLLRATTEDNVRSALEVGSSAAQNEFKALVPLILSVLRSRTFPKRKAAQCDFLADSLAGHGLVTPRRSRDICGAERAKERTRSPHKIIRREFYVECSCGYKGPARNDACRKCGARISYPMLP